MLDMTIDQTSGLSLDVPEKVQALTCIPQDFMDLNFHICSTEAQSELNKLVDNQMSHRGGFHYL